MQKSGSEHPGDTFMINTRFLLIVSVFLGNIVEPLIGRQEEARALYLWIFTFHMPLFVFVTGYFARYSLTGKQGKKVLQQIALQYIIFQTLYSVLDALVFQAPGIRHSFFIPYLLVWFLMGHIIWRLLMLLFQGLRLKHPLVAAVAIAVLIGYGDFDGGFLSVTRALVFMPFFVLGYSWDYARFEAILSGARRAAAAALSIILVAVLFVWAENINPRWLVGSLNYGEMNHPEWYAGVYRLLLYSLQLVASASLLAWVPRLECRITDWGRRTLYVFLLHGFVVRVVALSGVYDHINNTGELVLVSAFAVGATIVLSQPFIKRWTHPVIEPGTAWLGKVEEKAKGLMRAR